ncbi:MAG: hypothetical protein WCB96_01605, partial [Candidatus Aminicenantales bacterium]
GQTHLDRALQEFFSLHSLISFCWMKVQFSCQSECLGKALVRRKFDQTAKSYFTRIKGILQSSARQDGTHASALKWAGRHAKLA